MAQHVVGRGQVTVTELIDGYTIIVSPDSITVPASPTGVVSAADLTKAICTISVYKGDISLTAVSTTATKGQFSFTTGSDGCTISRPSPNGIKIDSVVGGTYQPTVNININLEGINIVTKKFIITKAYQGDTGPIAQYWGAWSATTQYYNDPHVQYMVTYNGHWYATIIKDPRTPIPLGTLPTNTTYWQAADESKFIATNLLLADDAYIGQLNSPKVYIGDNGTNGWVIDSGSISSIAKSGSTPLTQLTSDGKLIAQSADIKGAINATSLTVSSGDATTILNQAGGATTTYADNKAGEVQTNLDNLQIGGTNLLLQSDAVYTNNIYLIHTYTMSGKMIAGQKYTISIYGTLGADRTGFMAYLDGGSIGLAGSTNWTYDSIKGCYYITFTGKTSATYNPNRINVYQALNTGTSTSTITKIKLEIGNKATDWSPAPEDITSSISNINSALTDYIDGIKQTLQDQIDGEVDAWSGTAVPTLDNTPASDWNSNDLKDQHVGDTYMNVNSGVAYIFDKTGTTYSWKVIGSSAITKALADAAAAQATADGKMRILYGTTYPNGPYDVGDMFMMQNGSGTSATYVIYKCITKNTGTTSSSAHWTQFSNWVTGKDIDDAVDGIQIGGRNLCADVNMIYRYPSSTQGGLTMTYANHKFTIVSINTQIIGYKLKVSPGDIYTMSWKTSSPTGGVWRVYQYTTEVTGWELPTHAGNIFIQHSGTSFTVEAGTEWILFAVYNAGQDGWVAGDTIWDVQLEQGTKATAYSPSPEDVQAMINSGDLLGLQQAVKDQNTALTQNSNAYGSRVLLYTNIANVTNGTISLEIYNLVSNLYNATIASGSLYTIYSNDVQTCIYSGHNFTFYDYFRIQTEYGDALTQLNSLYNAINQADALYAQWKIDSQRQNLLFWERLKISAPDTYNNDPDYSGFGTNYNSSATADNHIILTDDPFGKINPVWETTCRVATVSIGGGFTCLDIPPNIIDSSKIYRVSVYVRSFNAGARTYFGAVGAYIDNNDTGVGYGNQYFGYKTASTSTGRWQLWTGYIMPKGTLNADCLTGSIYWCDTGEEFPYITSYKGDWADNVTPNFNDHIGIRVMQYNTAVGDRTQWYAPRFEQMNGNEPTIDDLLNKDLYAIQSTNNLIGYLMQDLNGGVLSATEIQAIKDANDTGVGRIKTDLLDATAVRAKIIAAGKITTTELDFIPVQSTNVIASINASAEGGGTLKILGKHIQIDGTVTFGSGYSPTEIKNASSSTADSKITAFHNTLGDLADLDVVEFSKLGTTVIQGQYIKTGLVNASYINTGTLSANLIAAGSITANKLDVGDLISNSTVTNYVSSTANAAAGAVQTNLDNMQIGGVNYYRLFDPAYWNITTPSVFTFDTANNALKTVLISGSQAMIYQKNAINIRPSSKYTINAAISGDTQRFLFRFKDSSGTIIQTSIAEFNNTYNAYYTGHFKDLPSTQVPFTFTSPSNAVTVELGFGPTASGSATTVLNPTFQQGDKATAWSLSPADVDAKIDNIQVGGENLFPNSSFEYDSPTFGVGGAYWKLEVPPTGVSPIQGTRVLRSYVGSNYAGYDIPCLASTNYTVSGWIYVSSDFNGTYARISVEHGSSQALLYDLNNKGTWQYVSKTFVTNTSYDHIRVLAYITNTTYTTGYILYDCIKVEKGNKATDWSASSQDAITYTNSQISNVNGVVALNASAITTLGGDTAFALPQKTISTGGWYRFAASSGSRSTAKFILRDVTSSKHATAIFYVNYLFSKTTFQLVAYDVYGNGVNVPFTKIRVVQWNAVGSSNPAYIEVYCPSTATLLLSCLENFQSTPWTAVQWTAGEIPTSYSAIEFPIDADHLSPTSADVAGTYATQASLTVQKDRIDANVNSISSQGTRLTTAEGNITINANNITSAVSRITTAEGKISTNTTAISQNASDITLEVTARKDLASSVGNLVNNPAASGNINGWGINSSAAGTASYVSSSGVAPFDSIGVLSMLGVSSFAVVSNTFKIDPSKAYQVEVWIKLGDNYHRGTNATTPTYYFGLGARNAANSTYTEVDRIDQSGVVTASGSSSASNNVYFQYAGLNTLSVNRWDHFTAYILPAGFDETKAVGLGNCLYNARISPDADNIYIRLYNYYNETDTNTVFFTQIKCVEVDSNSLAQISDAQASIKINSDSIALKVNKDDVVSAINLLPGTVQIDAKNINLTGAVTISSFDSASSNILTGKYIDTRDDNQPPSWYRSIFTSGNSTWPAGTAIIREFKRATAIADGASIISHLNGYVNLVTEVGWGSVSGGVITQTINNGDTIYKRYSSTTDATWTAWLPALNSGQAANDVNNGTTTIQGGMITTGTITATQIAANTITGAKIAAGTITATNIAAGTITSDKIATGSIVIGNLASSVQSTLNNSASTTDLNNAKTDLQNYADTQVQNSNIDTLPSTSGNPAKRYNLPQGASYVANGSVTGAIVIQTPVPKNNTMCTFHVKGYIYGLSSIVDLTINFYSYNSTQVFPNISITDNGTYHIDQIRLGYNSTTNTAIIILGAGTSTWSYPKVWVESMILSHGSTPNSYLTDGWSITALATFPSNFVSITDASDKIVIADGIRDELGDMAYLDLVSAAKLDSTVITGGYIKTSLLDVGYIKTQTITAANINALALSASSITTGTLASARIAANTITVAQLNFTPVQAGGAAADINAHTTTITGSKITTNSIDANRIITSTLTALGAVTAGSFNIGSGKFKVTTAGVLTATGATISGAITASSGAIGGWNISSASFYNDTAKSGFVSSGTTATPVLYLGQTLANRTTAPFRVYADGTLNATKFVLEGGSYTVDTDGVKFYDSSSQLRMFQTVDSTYGPCTKYYNASGTLISVQNDTGLKYIDYVPESYLNCDIFKVPVAAPTYTTTVQMTASIRDDLSLYAGSSYIKSSSSATTGTLNEAVGKAFIYVAGNNSEAANKKDFEGLLTTSGSYNFVPDGWYFVKGQVPKLSGDGTDNLVWYDTVTNDSSPLKLLFIGGGKSIPVTFASGVTWPTQASLFPHMLIEAGEPVDPDVSVQVNFFGTHLGVITIFNHSGTQVVNLSAGSTMVNVPVSQFPISISVSSSANGRQLHVTSDNDASSGYLSSLTTGPINYTYGLYSSTTRGVQIDVSQFSQ